MFPVLFLSWKLMQKNWYLPGCSFHISTAGTNLYKLWRNKSKVCSSKWPQFSWWKRKRKRIYQFQRKQAVQQKQIVEKREDRQQSSGPDENINQQHSGKEHLEALGKTNWKRVITKSKRYGRYSVVPELQNSFQALTEAASARLKEEKGALHDEGVEWWFLKGQWKCSQEKEQTIGL